MTDRTESLVERCALGALWLCAWLLVASALVGCASTPAPIPECPPCPPGPTVYVPVIARCAAIPLPPETPRPMCSGTSAEVVRCVIDYVQALRGEIAVLRDEIGAHNSESRPTP